MTKEEFDTQKALGLVKHFYKYGYCPYCKSNQPVLIAKRPLRLFEINHCGTCESFFTAKIISTN